jgi:hypothetical protein
MPRGFSLANFGGSDSERTTMIDYPKVRASHICPTCNGPKAPAERLLVCWPCFRDTRRVRTADMERTLREREAELSHIRCVNIGERPVTVAVAPDPNGSIDATVFLVSVWLGEMLDKREINAGSFNAMMRELTDWASGARACEQLIAAEGR